MMIGTYASRQRRWIRRVTCCGAMLLIVSPLVGCGSSASSETRGPNRDAGSSPVTRDRDVDATQLSTAEIEQAATQVDRYHAAVKQAGGQAELNLDFSRSDITDDDLAAMVFPESVRSINLSHTNISDAALAHLSRAQGLEQLMLVSTNVTDAGIEHLKELPRLTQVELHRTKVSRPEQLALLKLLSQRAKDQRRDRGGQ